MYSYGDYHGEAIRGPLDCYCNRGYYAPITGVLGPSSSNFICPGAYSGTYTFNQMDGIMSVYSKTSTQVFRQNGGGLWEMKDGIAGNVWAYGVGWDTSDYTVFQATRMIYREWCTNAWVLSTMRWRAYHTSACSACPVGATTQTIASRVISDCLCVEGYSGANGGVCTICGAGKYKTVLGSVACTNCNAGKYLTTTGATIESSCVDCGAGTYLTTTGATVESSCVNCLAGKYSTTSGASVLATCINCVANIQVPVRWSQRSWER